MWVTLVPCSRPPNSLSLLAWMFCPTNVTLGLNCPVRKGKGSWFFVVVVHVNGIIFYVFYNFHFFLFAWYYVFEPPSMLMSATVAHSFSYNPLYENNYPFYFLLVMVQAYICMAVSISIAQ